MARINEFWTEVFRDCGWPAYRPPNLRILSEREIFRLTHWFAQRYNAADRSAFYVFSHQNPPLLTPATLYVNEANTYTSRHDPYQVAAPPAYVAEITLAHETGHRVQDLRGTSIGGGGATPETRRREEMEADAFAGAYLHWLQQHDRMPIGMITAGNISRRGKGRGGLGIRRNSVHAAQPRTRRRVPDRRDHGIAEELLRDGIAVR